MTSTIPGCVIDDDDVFDWEAAVREIESRCVSTAPSTSNPVEPPRKLSKMTTAEAKVPFSSSTHMKPVAPRQSTLDKYMGKSTSSVQLDYRSVGDTDQDKIESVEELSSVKIDAEAAKFWIYPVNIPLRDYQLSITRTALFSNTMVSLPTGLGKTLIAAVVMYNYFRWFPEGKIVFAAPSRPLVTQQIEACHNIVGIPQEWTIQMTGKTSPPERARLWKSKRVFFVTPQVLEKDIQSGTCVVKQLVCLVIDEAHRASGNYAYCGAVRELMAVPVQFRILALTATPGEKQQAIQHVIDNLHISTIEYRNESDHDVSPYVHDRKIELVEVAMGQDAVEINSMLLEVIRPYVTKLSGTGVLPRRDYLTLSPMDFLASREKFREAPPADLPSVKHAEVEGYFGVLITLYHMRKLLLSHGIRPTYEMLEEKLQQGCFARYMSRNEVLSKVKILMQQNLSHGAPSPKLSKMLEVLVDHFKTKDPQSSRVIIFSHFRGSVRDIMEALKNIGDIVKATEFIGQSSGKTLKGQSQKIQQAVLQKFRAGGYNVIVATSIAEEGLDIMEVDLVLCFDANISPLRMIQRMGRTGRKREGRVVVLACEGSEVKGYLRKQAKGKSVKKLLRNGGMESFNFYPSPRMIPHIFKPEVHLTELSIDQFIHGQRKVKDDHPIQTPRFKARLTDAETELVANYFDPTNEPTWRPSLIAFPNFQAFPSRVHKVMHSFRTGLLIDAMQRLQGFSFDNDNKVPFHEEDTKSSMGVQLETGQQHEICQKDLQTSHGAPEEFLAKEVSDYEPMPVKIPSPVVQHCLRKSRIEDQEISKQENDVSDQTTSPNKSRGKNRLISELSNDAAEQENEMAETDCVLTPVSNINLPSETESMDGSPKREIQLADRTSNGFRDTELSPRIANFIESGFVPESPVENAGITEGIGRKRKRALSYNDSPAKTNNETLLAPSIPANIEVPHIDDRTCGDAPVSPLHEEIRTPINNVVCSPREEAAATAFPDIVEVKTPLANMTSSGCSENWCLNSGGKTQSIQKKVKFKRLRKYGDQVKQKPTFLPEQSNGSKPNSVRESARQSTILPKSGKGKSKPVKDARVFIEEEAEVSSEVEVSEDEEDEPTQSCDSFIDDRINPTAATQTQIEASRPDMMAIYRRSLLSQSPMVALPNGYSECSPNVRITECGSSSRFMRFSLETPESGSESACKSSVPSQIECGRTFSEAMPSIRDSSCENENKIESRKRKLSFYQAAESIPAVNLDKEFVSHSETCQEDKQVQTNQEDVFDDDDDQFYEGLDLDAVDEQVAKLLAQKKSEMLAPPPQTSIVPDPGVLCSPSFDLGI